MKKLFAFLKSLFIKIDVLEEKANKFVDETSLLSAEQKKKAKKTLSDIDKIEENLEDVVEKAEVAADKVVDVVENKNIASVGDAINSVKDVITEVKDVQQDAKDVADLVKKK
jgi:methyl-accepting chemotaxis protein